MNLSDTEILDRIERLAKEAGQANRHDQSRPADPPKPCGFHKETLRKLKLWADGNRGASADCIAIYGALLENNITYPELCALVDALPSS